MDSSAIESLLRSYFFDDFPKRVLDALVFGGIAAGAWTLVAGRSRRKVLKAFLMTHQDLVTRLKAVVEAIRDKENAEVFRDNTRRQLFDSHARLVGQQLHLFARLSDVDKNTLLNYFERVARVIKAIDFSVPTASADNGSPLDYTTINAFKGRLSVLFKPNPAEGLAVSTPMELACRQLELIVWSVYLLPILRLPKLKIDDAKSIDAALNEFNDTLKKSLSAEAKDWSDPQALGPFFQSASTVTQ